MNFFLYTHDVKRFSMQQANSFFNACSTLAFINKMIPRKTYLNSEMLDFD